MGWNSIKGLFVETETEPKSADKPKPVGDKPQPVTQPAYPGPVSGSVVLTPSNDEITNHLEEVLKTANENKFPGDDYYEFYKTKKVMAHLPTDELKYMTAFSVLSMNGLTKQKLVDTASQYVGVIDNDVKQFEASLAQAVDNNVTKKKQLIEAKAKEISELVAKVKILEGELQTLNGEVQASEAKFQTKRATFITAAQSMKDHIASEINNINTYIK